MELKEQEKLPLIHLGLDMGVYSVKGVLIDNGKIEKATVLSAGKPVEAARKCMELLLGNKKNGDIKLGILGQNAPLIAASFGIKPLLEIEALQAGLAYGKINADYIFSLGHENMHYLELDKAGQITYFSRNGQCAAGSGSFWYQQATRMGYNDRELAEIAVQAQSDVPISGRCAVFAKSDMTHAINEGATQSAVSAGMARALVENVVASVALNRIKGPGVLAASGGVANNRAVLKYLEEYASEAGVTLISPENHEYLNAIGAALKGKKLSVAELEPDLLTTPAYEPINPLPALNPDRVHYLEDSSADTDFDLTQLYLGVDCGSVSTKCVILDRNGYKIGGIYLPTTGRPALQVLALMKEIVARYGNLIGDAPIVACTTGSGRFLSQRIMQAEFAVDEITCQAEGVKYLFPNEENLSIIEIGGEDSKFIQLKNGVLFDYNMNPVCAAGTGTFLENLAELLNVKIKEEFSTKAFNAEYAVDLGDTCTLISQSILASASARGLPLEEQLCSLAYSSARNYLSKTVDKRQLNGKVAFAGATAKNHALAAALGAICDNDIYVPPQPELTGALGSALMARQFHQSGKIGLFNFNSLMEMGQFENSKKSCKAECKHEHKCVLNIITFSDGKKFIYGDRCGRYSGMVKKASLVELPDYEAARTALLEQFDSEDNSSGIKVGLARAGLYFEYFPFWSAFFRELGCAVILSDKTTAETLQKGKIMLDSEMCYPMKVIVGHYEQLKSKEPDYVFLPEVVDMEALPWAEQWPRSFTCPLLQTLRGTIVNSVGLNPEKVLYAQLNYRGGKERIARQLRSAAKIIMGASFSEKSLVAAVDKAYKAQHLFRKELIKAGEAVFQDLHLYSDNEAVVFLSRSYTLYDELISKKSMHYGRQSGLLPIPYELLFVYLQAWENGEIESPYLEPFREEFLSYMQEQIELLENIYPAQLQKMLSTVILINYLNSKKAYTGLPRLNMILLDPFKCGPNAMMRHYLNNMTSYLRLTLDEHTGAAGMITRLEAYRNTCGSNSDGEVKPVMPSSKTCSVVDSWDRIIIPNPTDHAALFAALFRKEGVKAELLSRSKGDLSLGQRYANGDECLPFIQNLQDFIEHLQSDDGESGSGDVYFQGWACGPCRYGLYAPTQSLALNKAGFGDRRVCSVKFSDIRKRFGLKFVLAFYNTVLTMDLLYKMLHRARPYEKTAGSADQVFQRYSHELEILAESYNFPASAVLTGSYRKPLEKLIGRAAAEFSKIAGDEPKKPRIILAGEFYVRIDSRCNQAVIEKIEQAGGEVSISPVTELFSYTIYIDYLEALHAFKLKRRLADFLKQTGYGLIVKLIHRDEVALGKAAGALLDGLHEPSPQEIMAKADKYVSTHYGGEPPMTIGRTVSFAERGQAAGAVVVAPFTCMPASVVEAQLRSMQADLDLPIVAVYYDGQNNANRDELVEGLVYQARQKFEAGGA